MKLFLSLLILINFGPLTQKANADSMDLYRHMMDYRANTQVTVDSSQLFRVIFTYNDGRAMIEPIATIPRGTRLSFLPSSRLLWPTIAENFQTRRATHHYFGGIQVDLSSIDSWETRQKLQDSQARGEELFIFEWHIDKTSFLRQVYDIPATAPVYRMRYEFAWDNISRGGYWTNEAIKAIVDQGSILLNNIPSDVDEFCPNFRYQDAEGRAAFWIEIINILGERESRFFPLADGDESRFGMFDRNGEPIVSRGILQMSINSISARYRNKGCNARTAEDLHTPVKNIQCGIAIMTHWIETDNCISCDVPTEFREEVNEAGEIERIPTRWNRRGLSRYWSPLRVSYQASGSSLGARDQIKERLKNSAACKLQ